MQKAKQFLMSLCIVTLGAICWTSCADEDDALKPTVPSESSATSGSDEVSTKAGSNQVMIQTFTLFTERWPDIQAKAAAWGQAGFNIAWLPPASRAADNYGYLPTQWYDFNNWRGSNAQLTSCMNALKSNGMMVIADVVLNHRNGNATAGADFVNPAFANNAAAVTSSDECGCGTGGADQGNDFNGGRDLNHNNASVQTLSREFMGRLSSIGFQGGRYDMVIGYSAAAASTYKLGSFQVGEYWVDSRTTINNWANAAGMNAFDFTTYNRLRTAVAGNYSVLGGLPGLIGLNKGRAVTMAGNHDTPSSGHLGLVYIMTHPGIPSVGVEDWYAHSALIRTLIGIRRAQGIGQTSTTVVQTATSSVYAAITDGKVAMKIGPGAWSPSGSWTLATSGTNYAIWTAGGSSTTSSTSTSGGGTVTITLRMLKDVGQGNTLYFTGNNAPLTNWGNGIAGTWTTGNYWTRSVTMPAGVTSLEWKVRLNSGGTWESGSNHVNTGVTNGSTYTATFNGGF